MDVLSDVITATRAGKPHAARTHQSGAWEFVGEPFAGFGFHVVRQGSCLLTPPAGEPVPLSAGDVVCVLPRRTAYRLSGFGDTRMLCGAYFLDRSRPHPLLDELPDVIHLTDMAGPIDLLDAELAEPQAGSDAIVPALLDTLLLYALRAWYKQNADIGGWASAVNDPGISTALRAIHDAPEHPWTVEELGARAGLSRAAFARRFTDLVGRPPLAYLTWWRMTMAAKLLRDTDLPVGGVAGRAGYSSEFAFAKAFKRAFGLPPGGYRRMRAG
ncbi:AraC family transcriptional regulator [Kibdelosporangium persicum]|uniref:HTH-type transcriptional activator Btr n=1 Tax=Kibdelosporangium persicum TaxID=2698649 RepID=A0ABX2F9N9_9PSEU|nr:AraC family transcriptional regulator [Kibdelosporangium persicum]NRN68074.1 HTH-type transcriptional activator Btr [Kibdelosporangium persicum]